MLTNKIKKIIDRLKDSCFFLFHVVTKKKIKPNAIYIEPTNICNANCIFCAYQFYQEKKEIISMALLKKILQESKDINVQEINLTPFAGEILTDKTIVEKILLIKEFNFKSVSTYTNLINLHRFQIEDILNSGLTTLNVSMAPLDKSIYQKIYRSSKYDIFLENLIKLLMSYNSVENKTLKKLNLEFRSNISYNDCLSLPDFKEKVKPLIDEKKITISVMQTYDSWMGSIKENDLLEGMKLAKPNGIKRIPCSRLNNIQVLSNGNLRVCGCRFNNQSQEDIFLLGNIKQMTIIEAYNSKKVLNLKKSFFEGNPPIECQKCSWYS